MPISFECSGCGATLNAKEQYSGRRIKCPHCETANRVPAENEESVDDDEVVSSKQTRRKELPQPLKRKKKKPSRKSKSGSGGKVPAWAIVAGSIAGFLSIAAIVFIVMKPPAQAANGQVAVGGQAEPAKVVQAHVDGPGAKFRVKFELPVNWKKSEGSIEDEMFPWATMEGEGQTIKLSSNKSLLGGVEAMTAIGGPVEVLKTSHSGRGTKLKSESTDWVEGQLSVHEGKRGPVIWSDYEYKGFFGKRYGIRCTLNGPVRPCTLMLECGQSARDKWRPTLLAIAESIHYVGMKDGKEERNDLGIRPGDEMPDVDLEKNGDPEERP